MRSAAVIGSGIAGLLTAHGLLRKGFAVSLYSDRTGEQWMTQCRPTGTAARFDRSLDFDRELGLAHFESETPPGEGVSLNFCLKPGKRLITLLGRLEKPFRAVDVRLLSARWLRDLEERGGRVEYGAVSIERLDQIAAAHELTIVAAGRGELCQLFARDAGRSVYEAPQRNLCMLITRGARQGFDRVPFLPVRFNAIAPVGEAFFIPYLHKDGGATWNLLFEAKPSGPMDRFQKAKTGDEALALAKQVLRDLLPWEADWAAPMELADPNGWLVGGVTPTVRHPVAMLPSGRVVTGVGDTLMSLDPIAGQGANNGTRMARHLVDSAVARGDGAFDAQWMTDTFERYWSVEGQHIVQFNNLLLEPMTAAGRLLLISQMGSTGVHDSVPQRIANLFAGNFNQPASLTPALVHEAKAREIIGRAGGSWPWTFAAGALRVAGGQLRQAFGAAP